MKSEATRRELLILLAAAGTLIPLAARAQNNDQALSDVIRRTADSSLSREGAFAVLQGASVYVSLLERSAGLDGRVPPDQLQRSRATVELAYAVAARAEIPDRLAKDGLSLIPEGTLTALDDGMATFNDVISQVGVSPGSLAAQFMLEGIALTILIAANQTPSNWCIFPFCVG